MVRVVVRIKVNVVVVRMVKVVVVRMVMRVVVRLVVSEVSRESNGQDGVGDDGKGMVVKIVVRKVVKIVVGEDGAVDGGEDGDKGRTDKMHLQKVEILRNWHQNLRMTTPKIMILKASSKSMRPKFYEKKRRPSLGERLSNTLMLRYVTQTLDL